VTSEKLVGGAAQHRADEQRDELGELAHHLDRDFTQVPQFLRLAVALVEPLVFAQRRLDFAVVGQGERIGEAGLPGRLLLGVRVVEDPSSAMSRAARYARCLRWLSSRREPVPGTACRASPCPRRIWFLLPRGVVPSPGPRRPPAATRDRLPVEEFERVLLRPSASRMPVDGSMATANHAFGRLELRFRRSLSARDI